VSEAFDEMMPQLFPALQKCLKGLLRTDLARDAPIHEFRHINPSHAHFALMNPRLAAAEPQRQVPLGQFGLLPDLAKQFRHRTVVK
jgi:hypothetical protein